MSRPSHNPAGGPVAPSVPKEALVALRKALGLTQQEVADRSVGLVSRFVLADVETGGNKLTQRSAHRGIARGLGLTEEELDELLAEKISAEDLGARVLARDAALRARVDARSKPKANVEPVR